MGGFAASKRFRAAALIGLGTALAPLDTAVNVALPGMTGAFGLPLGGAQWIVIAYVLTYASLLLAIGRIGDLFGHRAIFRFGLLWSAGALLLCALAPSYAWLLIGRFAQGIGTALVLACGPALLTSLYDERERGYALGLYTMMVALGSGAGPLIGGGLVQLWGWRTVFWFRVPIALLALALLPRQAGGAAAGGPARQPFDLAGAGLFALSLASFLLALNRLPLLASGDGSGLAWLAVAALGGAGFVWRELQTPAPMIDLGVFRTLDFSLLNLASVAINLSSFAVLLLLPYYLSRILALAALHAGLVLAAAAIGTVLGSSLAGRWLSRRPAQPMALAGGLLAALGLVGVGIAAGRWPESVLAAILLAGGVGVGIFQTAYMDLVVAAIPSGNRGVAGSLAMLTRTIGVVVGATLLTVIFQAFERQAARQSATLAEAFVFAFRWSFLLAACISLAVIVLGLLLARRRRPG
ncbi:MAG TPA: MFS transporter [Candidatus Sulfotelmatobacter sp.]|nr:MFS transporter [Candidatus Sulfotelmatobacter sp.]